MPSRARYNLGWLLFAVGMVAVFALIYVRIPNDRVFGSDPVCSVWSNGEIHVYTDPVGVEGQVVPCQ